MTLTHELTRYSEPRSLAVWPRGLLVFHDETSRICSSSMIPQGASPWPDEQPACPWHPWYPSAHSWTPCPPHHTACADHWLSETGFDPPGLLASRSCSAACQPSPRWCWRSPTSLPDSQSWNRSHAFIHSIFGVGKGVGERDESYLTFYQKHLGCFPIYRQSTYWSASINSCHCGQLPYSSNL